MQEYNQGYLDGYTSQDHRERWNSALLLEEIQKVALHMPFSIIVDAIILALSKGSKFSSYSRESLKEGDMAALEVALVGSSPTNSKGAVNVINEE